MSKSGRSHFQPGDGPRRGLLYSVIVNLQTSRRFVSSSAADCTVHYRGVTAPGTWAVTSRITQHHTELSPGTVSVGTIAPRHVSRVTCHVSLSCRLTTHVLDPTFLSSQGDELMPILRLVS